MSDLDDAKQWWASVIEDDRFYQVISTIKGDFQREFEVADNATLLAHSVPMAAMYGGALKFIKALTDFAAVPDFNFGKPVPETYPDEIEEINALKTGQDTEKQPPCPPKKPRTKRK